MLFYRHNWGILYVVFGLEKSLIGLSPVFRENSLQRKHHQQELVAPLGLSPQDSGVFPG